MILMSDGKNTSRIKDGGGIPFHDAPPYVDAHYNPQPSDVAGTDADTTALCEAIKAEGTEITL